MSAYQYCPPSHSTYPFPSQPLPLVSSHYQNTSPSMYFNSYQVKASFAGIECQYVIGSLEGPKNRLQSALCLCATYIFVGGLLSTAFCHCEFRFEILRKFNLLIQYPLYAFLVQDFALDFLIKTFCSASCCSVCDAYLVRLIQSFICCILFGLLLFSSAFDNSSSVNFVRFCQDNFRKLEGSDISLVLEQLMPLLISGSRQKKMRRTSSSLGLINGCLKPKSYNLDKTVFDVWGRYCLRKCQQWVSISDCIILKEYAGFASPNHSLPLDGLEVSLNCGPEEAQKIKWNFLMGWRGCRRWQACAVGQCFLCCTCR